MSEVLEVAVLGRGVWNPATPARPQPAILPPNERRRAPDTVAVALEVANSACVDAGRDPAQLATVFASTYGDLAITDYMCRTLASAPATLSPTRFHNSVHNAAAGYWSIATGCHEPYLALGAGQYTFAAGLLAAALQVCADGCDVLFVAYDIAAPEGAGHLAFSQGVLGLALVLGAGSAEAPALLRLKIRPAAATSLARVAGNAMAGCLPLIGALEAARPANLDFALGPESALAVDFSVGSKKSR